MIWYTNLQTDHDNLFRYCSDIFSPSYPKAGKSNLLHILHPPDIWTCCTCLHITAWNHSWIEARISSPFEEGEEQYCDKAGSRVWSFSVTTLQWSWIEMLYTNSSIREPTISTICARIMTLSSFHEYHYFCRCIHYIDFIKTTIASQITGLMVVFSTVYSDADQRKHWDRWIPRAKGQLSGECFHLKTSSRLVLLTSRIDMVRYQNTSLIK